MKNEHIGLLIGFISGLVVYSIFMDNASFINPASFITGCIGAVIGYLTQK